MMRSARSFAWAPAILAALLSGISPAPTLAQANPPPAAPPPSGQQPAPQQAAPQQPIQIDRNGVLILIRTTLLALDQANRTGNYTVLRDLGAPGFQAGNTAARLGDIFANLRAQNLDLSGVAVLEPQLTVLPTAVQGGLMRMAGFFPSVPTQVNFDLLFAPIEGRWRVFGLSLNLGQATPTAPQSPEPTPTEPVRPEPSKPHAMKQDDPAGARKPAVASKPPPRPARPQARPQAQDRPEPSD